VSQRAAERRQRAVDAGLFEAIVLSLKHEAAAHARPAARVRRRTMTGGGSADYYSTALKAIQRLLLGHDRATAARAERAVRAGLVPALYGVLQHHIADRRRFADLAVQTVKTVVTYLQVEPKVELDRTMAPFPVLFKKVFEAMSGLQR
jgi:hypothetical protein